MQFVLDASAMLRLFLDDGPIEDSLYVAMAQVESGEASFVVPELFWAEAAHVLHRRRKQKLLSVDELNRLWGDMSALPARTLGHLPFMQEAFGFADEFNLSVYDALYLSIAVAIEVPLLTADDQLNRAASKLDILPR
jgi:predicted nucleic acid-binding protein